jgi:DNA polymerase/3'-5' exonuclease PolX
MSKKPLPRDVAIERTREFMSMTPFDAVDYFICGSIRREVDVVGDVDLIITGKFKDNGKAERYKESGGAKSRTYNYRDVQINMWNCKPEQLGSFILYATGSGLFGKALRGRAMSSDLKLSQYGLFNRRTNQLLESACEKRIFNLLGLKYVQPFARKDNYKPIFKAYRLKTEKDLTYQSRLIGRVVNRTIYPENIRHILTVSVPVGLLRDFISEPK